MPITDFTSSNLMRFDRPIAYRIDYPLSLAPEFGSTDSNFFVEKQDPLGFRLDLGSIRMLFSGVFIYLRGTVTNESDGIINWQIDNDFLPEDQRPVGKTILGYTITRIEGQLTSSISDITPVVDTANISGENRLYRTSINFIGDQNILNITVTSGLLVYTASVHILSAAARCGVNVPSFRFDVSIHYNNWQQDGCGHRYLMLDEPVTFTAGIYNVVSEGRPDTIKYFWEFYWRNDAGEWDLDLTRGPSFDPPCPILPYRTGLLKIRAIVDITTDSTLVMENGLSSFELQMVVQNEETLGFARAICELRRNMAGFYSILARGVGAGFTAGGIRFVDPLWDPTPDILRNVPEISHPYTLEQLQQIQSNMQRTAKYASQIVSASSKLIEKQKMKTVASIEKQLKLAKNNVTAIDLKKEINSPLSLPTPKK